MDTKIILQAVYYLSTKLGTIDKLHAIKYFYFADKYHLMKYSRMITNDTYYAMKMGPVASNVKNILSNDDFDNPEEEQLFSLYLKKSGKYGFETASDSLELDMLSETDKEALDFAVDNFKDVDDIVEETHKYPEWKRYEETFKKNVTKREKIIMADFFELSGEKNDPYSEIPTEIREMSKEFFFEERAGSIV